MFDDDLLLGEERLRFGVRKLTFPAALALHPTIDPEALTRHPGAEHVMVSLKPDADTVDVRPDWHDQGVCVIVDRNTGLLPLLPNLWGWELRLDETLNTCRSYLQDIALLLEGERFLGFSLAECFRTSTPLKKREVEQIITAMAYHCLRDGTTVESSPASHARRLTSVCKYLIWGYERYMADCDESRYRRLDHFLTNLRRWFKKATPSKSIIEEATNSPDPLSNEQLAVLRLLLTPGVPMNPFSGVLDGALQHRNRVLVLLLLETGMRPSALCLLEKRDFKPEERSIYVSKHMPNSQSAENDKSPSYRRRRKFGAKQGRRAIVGHKTVNSGPIILSETLCSMLQDYIDNHHPIIDKARRQTPGRRRGLNPVMFISHRDGGPLTPDGVRNLVKRIGHMYSALGNITTYSFRHTSATVSARVMRQALKHLDALSRDQALQEALTVKHGWARHSDMPRHYARWEINELLEQLASEDVYAQSTISAIKIANVSNREDAANDAVATQTTAS